MEIEIGTLPIQQLADGTWEVQIPSENRCLAVSNKEDAIFLASAELEKNMAWSQLFDSEQLADDLDKLSALFIAYSMRDGAREFKAQANEMRELIRRSGDWDD